MLEYIQKDAALNCFHDWIDSHGDVHTADEMPEYLAIEALTPVDAAPVVRCKDCIHWDERKGEKYCEEMYFNQDDPKFYCGYAERRENAVD